jgi:uracil-DNA glycosylase
MSINNLIHQLATAVPPANCENPYLGERPFASQRRHNLKTYLQLLAQQRPTHLLIGEAPGYRGCRLTGIPFVSPHILGTLHEQFRQPTKNLSKKATEEKENQETLNLISKISVNSVANMRTGINPFQAIAEWPQFQKEASATIVWRTIGTWHPLPLLWNIFPFHPHQPGKPQSNRTPTTREVAAGRPFLNQLLQIFPQVKLVAVGKKASTGLAKWGMEHTAVRHPSHGGAKQFQTVLSKLN